MSGPLGSSQWMYASGEDYQIPYSLRFDNARETNLKRTPGSESNRQAWVCSFWMKRHHTSTQRVLFAEFGSLYENTSGVKIQGDQIRVDEYISSYTNDTTGDSELRDPTAWTHVLVSFDTTQATAANRIEIYINGVEETYGSTSFPPEDDQYSVNGANIHKIGCGSVDDEENFEGYLAEFHFIDRASGSEWFTANDGTRNGSFNIDTFGERGDYGEWKPKEVTGVTYGTNGYYLDFADSAAPGNDVSGNNNDWTNDGFTANDQMIDTPTNNFCTINVASAPINQRNTISEGMLKAVKGTVQSGGRPHSSYGSFTMTSGKWYFEMVHGGTGNDGDFHQIGIMDPTYNKESQISTDSSPVPAQFMHEGWGYWCGGEHSYIGIERFGTLITNTYHDDGYATAAGEIIACAFDIDAGKIWFAQNNTWQDSGDPAAGTNAAYDESTSFSGFNYDVLADPVSLIIPAIALQDATNDYAIVNFGADSSFAGTKTAQGNQDSNDEGDFYYTPPAGFLAMCTKNIATPDAIPAENFNTKIYTGTGTSQVVSGVGFQPDMIWVKNRGAGYSGGIFDALRGLGSASPPFLDPAATDAESDDANYIASVGSDGYTSGSSQHKVNNTGSTYVAWNWKAGNATLGTGAFTQGTIASTCSRNTDLGFSIVSYTGTGSNGTVGHGLSKAPRMIMIKNRDANDAWVVYHAGGYSGGNLSNAYYTSLDSDATHNNDSTTWNATYPAATVFSIGTLDKVNTNTEKYIAYCFHSVPNMTRVSTWRGNNNADGFYVWTGFKPAFVMIKQNAGTGNWVIIDNKRNVYNDETYSKVIYADSIEDEETAVSGLVVDFLSNGYKMRGTNTNINGNADFYIGIAFAATPFKYANAN